MANSEHIRRLTQGVDMWNDWRKMNAEIRPDLSRANLGRADLSGARLSWVYLVGADLSGADLSGAHLNGANLNGAQLNGAQLNKTHLSFADLSGVHLNGTQLNGAQLDGANLVMAHLNQANLSGANLSFVNLVGANLNEAHLGGADLSRSHLNGVDFHTTRLQGTIFAWVDLCAVEGLNTVIHEGPSTINVNTVKLPEGKTRTLFLRGTGFSGTFIDYYQSLFTAAIQYASCFISYAHQDEALAQQLYKNLQDKGVRCWFAPEDLKTGDKIRARIDHAIHLHEKLLLLLSEHSLTSTWVEDEVEAALEKERLQQREVLVPIRLDESVMQPT